MGDEIQTPEPSCISGSGKRVMSGGMLNVSHPTSTQVRDATRSVRPTLEQPHIDVGGHGQTRRMGGQMPWVDRVKGGSPPRTTPAVAVAVPERLVPSVRCSPVSLVALMREVTMLRDVTWRPT